MSKKDDSDGKPNPFDASKFDFEGTSLTPEEVNKFNDAIMTLITARVVDSHYLGEDPSLDEMRKAAKIKLEEAGGEDLFNRVLSSLDKVQERSKNFSEPKQR